MSERAGKQGVREWIHTRVPVDGVVGEGFGETPGVSHRRWLLDPIDGAKSFVRGVPLWATYVGVCEWVLAQWLAVPGERD